MIIFGNEIEAVDFAESKFYNLEQICKALDLDLQATIAFMQRHISYNVVQTKNAAWIDYSTLLRWMLLPELQKVLSPKAMEYAKEVFNQLSK
ncbi:MAG: hypothetical protein PF694_09215 [Bacteroidetes bacterium]|jgi:hypothetical protein|nr:hypothetical protein [Bacteroidota bacterium]